MPQQIWRLLVVFGLLVAALVLARHFLIPKTFGEVGHYRAAAVDSIAARKVKYAGRETCAICHDDIARNHGGHRHAGLSCEVCHGSGAAHADAPSDVHLQTPRQRAQCLLCHAYDPSRPTGFPQIDPVAHNAPKPCVGCHNPHAPEPPRAPEECGACHGQIARTKAVSPHAVLACTQCHQTEKRHMVNPAASRPSKPASREFCGQCHARGAPSSKEIPRVDLETHGQRYVCWQCHYPHSPELK